MIYGLCGSSGTGKSTTAGMVGERLNMPFIPTSITEMAQKAGYNAVGAMTLSQRLDLQEKLADQFEALLKSIDGNAILDRTPVDMLGYMLGEVHMQSHESLTEDEMTRLGALITRCKRMTALYFDHIFLMSVLPFYEVAETRPAMNIPYQYHSQMLMTGMLIDLGDRVNHSLLLTTDLETRVDYIAETISDRLVELDEFRKSHPRLH